MAEITAAEVSKLRKVTGAGMMDCKKALEESNGDFNKAIEYQKKAIELADDQTKEEYKKRLKAYEAHKPWREQFFNETIDAHGGWPIKKKEI